MFHSDRERECVVAMKQALAALDDPECTDDQLAELISRTGFLVGVEVALARRKATREVLEAAIARSLASYDQ